MRRKLELYSLLGGAGLTLVSAILPVTTVLGNTHYGLPLPWLAREGAGSGAAWIPDPLFLVLDVAFWTALVMLGFAAYQHQGER